MQKDNGLKEQWLSDNYYFAPASFNALNSIIHLIFFEYDFTDKYITDTAMLPKSILLFILILFLIGSVLVCTKIYENSSGVNKKLSLNFDGLFLISPVYFFLILSYLGFYPFCNRVILFLVPSMIIVIFKLFDYCGKNKFTGTLNLLMIIILSASFFIYIKKINVLFPLITNNFKTIETIERIKQLDKLDNNTIIIMQENPCTYCNNYDKIVVDTNKNIDDNAFLVRYVNKDNKVIIDNVDISCLLKDKNKIYFINLYLDNKDIIISKLTSLGWKKENIDWVDKMPSYPNDMFSDYYVFKKD